MGLEHYRSKHEVALTAERPRMAVQRATLVEDLPSEGLWLAETMLDGYRLLAQIDDGRVRLWTRCGEDWSRRLPGIVGELQRLPLRHAWLDGELLALDRAGGGSFPRLQRLLARDGGDMSGLRYYLFDLLALDGSDLRARPLLERKERLRELLTGTLPEVLGGSRGGAGLATGERSLRYCGHVIGRLDEAFRAACLQGSEGLLLKRVDAPYQAGRSPSWLKLRCGHRQAFVVVGYTLPVAPSGGIGTLVLGYYTRAGELAFAGSVSTGVDHATRIHLATRLAALASPQCPFPRRPELPWREDMRWVCPDLVADVRFSGWTRQEHLREPRFIGLREDKPAREVARERALPATALADGPPAAATTAATISGRVGDGDARGPGL